MEPIPQLIQELRHRGVSINQIALEVGVEPRTIYRWSNDETHPACADMIRRTLVCMVTEMDGKTDPEVVYI